MHLLVDVRQRQKHNLMVELLFEHLINKGIKIVLVFTPQNVKENNNEKCIKSLFTFSPVYSKWWGSAVKNEQVSELTVSVSNKETWSFGEEFRIRNHTVIFALCRIVISIIIISNFQVTF